MRHGGEHRHGRLADRHDVRVGAEHANELDDVVDEVVEVEAAHGERDVARVDPIGDVDFVVGQHRLDGAAQQRRVVTRHRRHDQHLGVVALAGERGLVALEVQQTAERRRGDDLLAHRDLDAADARRLETELGLAVAARDVLEQLAGGGEVAAVRRVGERIERRVEHATQPAYAKAQRRKNRVSEFICVVVHRPFLLLRRSSCSAQYEPRIEPKHRLQITTLLSGADAPSYKTSPRHAVPFRTLPSGCLRQSCRRPPDRRNCPLTLPQCTENGL